MQPVQISRTPFLEIARLMSQNRPFSHHGMVCAIASRTGRTFSVISSSFAFVVLFLKCLPFETCGMALTASTSTSWRASSSTRAEGRRPVFERSATGPNKGYNRFLNNTYVALGYNAVTGRLRNYRRPWRHNATAMAGMRVGLFSSAS
jgi:hypothetical protein